MFVDSRDYSSFGSDSDLSLAEGLYRTLVCTRIIVCFIHLLLTSSVIVSEVITLKRTLKKSAVGFGDHCSGVGFEIRVFIYSHVVFSPSVRSLVRNCSKNNETIQCHLISYRCHMQIIGFVNTVLNNGYQIWICP